MSSYKTILDELRLKYPEYDFTDTKVVSMKTSITYKCHIHGDKQQQPKVLLKNGCGECKFDLWVMNDKAERLEKLYEEIQQTHGQKYSYPKLDEEYVNRKSYITILCKEHNKEFSQQVKNHIYMKQGCPICSEERKDLGERLGTVGRIEQEVFMPFLKEIVGDTFIQQKPFRKKGKGFYYIDFFLPEKNIAIEFDEMNHLWGKAKRENDKVRQKYLEGEYGIRFIRVLENDFEKDRERVRDDLLIMAK
jgi:very-short-patch-repair endonuclease